MVHVSVDRIPVDSWDVERSIVEVFEERVATSPHNLAVRTDTECFTYEQLNSLANHIGHEILRQHNDEAPTVALLMNNSAVKVAAAVGVIKAGFGYVPLNLSVHDSGLQELIEHAQCTLLLTDSDNASRIHSIATEQCRVINVHAIERVGFDHNPQINIQSGSLAHLKYTSGSTGNPKGVPYSHRVVLHGAGRFRVALDLSESDAVTFFGQELASLMFATLLSGACLCPLEAKRGLLVGIGPSIQSRKITKCHAFPTAFRHFVEAAKDARYYSSVNCLYLGGEPIRASDFDLYNEYFPQHCVLVNSYGGTEFGGGATAEYLHKGERPKNNRFPVGRPYDGLELLLLDEHNDPVEDGESGEIAVKSRFIPSGYWRQHQMTRQKFLQDRLGQETIFLTGDLGQFDSEGRLCLIGRKDHQVKIRNYRVLPAEIEEALMSRTGVEAAIVVPFENDRSETQLACYVIMQKEASFCSMELADFLKERLPEYMVPAQFVALDSLPLTPSGKIDRKALPPIQLAQRSRSKIYRAPSTEIEKKLSAVWKQVLGVNDIGVDDDFFDQGGDSLQATWLILEVRSRFGVELKARTIFELATISSLAQEIERLRSRNESRFKKNVSVEADIDFAEFNAVQHVSSKAELYYIDPINKLRRAKPNIKLGPIVTNSLGFRSPEIPVQKAPGTMRLAFLGNSATFDSHASSNQATWPQVTWDLLKRACPNSDIDFLNAALPAGNSRRMTLIFEHVVADLTPDLVVIGLSDMNPDTAYFARESGSYNGVHYRPSWLAAKSALWSKIENNLTILMRLVLAQSEWGKTQCDTQKLSRSFEERLTRLVRLCQEKGASVALVSGLGRLRPGQSRWQKTKAAITNVFYMPYFSIDSIVSANETYRRVINLVAEETGSILIDARAAVPGDSLHYVDSNHFRDQGSQCLAENATATLLNAPQFLALLDRARQVR